MDDFLLLVNTVLGLFAGATNAYYAYRVHQIDQRIFRGSVSLLCVTTGMFYGAGLLGYIPPDKLSPIFLRPTLAMILAALAASPFFYAQDGIFNLERQIVAMRNQLAIQDEEIGRLKDVIKALVKQFAGIVPESVTPDILKVVVGAVPPPILVAAVESAGLMVRNEVDAIFDSALPYEYLPPPVSQTRLIAELDRLRPQAVHLLGHMSATGLVMADGEAPIGWWRRVFKRYGVQFFFANGCESLDIVDALHMDGVQCVIGVRGAVKDQAALKFATEFYSWLSKGRSASESVELAKLSLSHEDAEQVVIRGDWRYR